MTTPAVNIQANSHNLWVSGVQTVDIEQANIVTVNDLLGTNVGKVGVDLGEMANIQYGPTHQVVVNVAHQHIAVSMEKVALSSALQTRQNPHPKEVDGGAVGVIVDHEYEVISGDLARVTAGSVYQHDDVTVNAQASGTTFDVYGTTGPVTLQGGPGQNQFNIHVNAPLPSLPNPARTSDYLGTVNVNAGNGPNTLSIDESGAKQADNVTLNGSEIIGTLLPKGVVYQPSPGTTFDGGITLTTTPFADTVFIHDTLRGVTTTVNTGAGDDTINVSTDVIYDASIHGTLNIDAGSGTNTLNVAGRTTISAPDNLLVTGSQVVSTAVPFTLNYATTGGALVGSIDLTTGTGRDIVNLHDTRAGFRYAIHTSGGNDIVNVRSVPAGSSTFIEMGNGDTTLNVNLDSTVVVHNQVTGPDLGSGVLTVGTLGGGLGTISYRQVTHLNVTPDADHSFVQALYHDVLKRNGTPAELEQWVQALQLPGGSRAAVARGIETSAEARGLLVKGWFAQYFGRSPTPAELAAAVTYLLQGHTEEETLKSIFDTLVHLPPGPSVLSVAETFNRYAVGFAVTVYRQFLDHAPTSAELNAAVQFLQSHSAGTFVGSIMTSTEYRTRMIRADFAALLHRQPTPAELSQWVTSGQDLTAIRIGLESLPEFYNNGY